MTLKSKALTSAIATGALFLNMALPTLAVTIQVTGNGEGSTNASTTQVVNTTTVVQDNTANISNNVSANSNSGGNSATGNTGGSVSVSSDSATTSVAVLNTANANVADVAGCCNTNADVLIQGNGEDSDNGVELGLTHETSLFQKNVAKVNNDVDANATSGDNLADSNTGGDVSINAGSAKTSVVLGTTANANLAHVGGSGNNNGSISAQIVGNGEDSLNTIALGVANSVVATQGNYANVTNDVDADALSGGNTVEGTTDGSSSITTGEASVEVGVDNLANFNFADLDCGCLLDVLASISENGQESDNAIAAELVDSQEAFQANVWTCGHNLLWAGHSACNDLEANASSGDNLVDGGTGGDSDVDAGASSSTVVVENAGNANVVGNTSMIPELDLGFDFGVNLHTFWNGLFHPMV